MCYSISVCQKSDHVDYYIFPLGENGGAYNVHVLMHIVKQEMMIVISALKQAKDLSYGLRSNFTLKPKFLMRLKYFIPYMTLSKH